MCSNSCYKFFRKILLSLKKVGMSDWRFFEYEGVCCLMFP
jgi:hypothetical protein